MAASNAPRRKIRSIGPADNPVDPTENVRALVGLEVKRIDDLRESGRKHQEQLRKAETRRIDQQATLRAFYDEKLRDAEAKRIDAIRAVDVNAVAVANERANAQAQVLATQVAASAEALRTLVATTSGTVAEQFNQVTQQILARIAALEQANYEGRGKATYTDPAQAALLMEVQRLSQAGDRRSGAGMGADKVIAYIGMAAGIAFGIFALLKQG